MRDLEENPYTEDEKRVAKFFADKGVGGGDDPIGFMLASYEYLVQERNEVMGTLKASVELQSHYAELLNMHDGGERRTFANVRAWIDRLRETKS